MKILALDTALPAVSVCVFESTSGASTVERIEMRRGHAEALLPLVQRVMAEAGCTFRDLDRIAVTVGPGSFTGIRVGLSAARAFGLACKIPVVGVSTLAAFAVPLILEGGEETIISAIDAYHGQAYVQGFTPAGAIIGAPQAIQIDRITDLFGRGPFRIVGNGAPAIAIAAWSRAIVAEVSGETVAPDILAVARLGLLADPETAPRRPLYIKPPDVKLPEVAPA